MFKKELIHRSPVRVLENSIHGGLGIGNLGVVSARKGVGKTACLAHIAIDKMMRGENVLHISFADEPHHVENWYRQLFDELANLYKLENAFDVYDEIKPHRLIIHFKDQNVTVDHISKMIDDIEAGSDFKPETIIVDGQNFEHMTLDTLSGWKKLAVNQKASIWFAVLLHREQLNLDDQGIPFPINRFSENFSVIIMLEPRQDYIDMKLLKDHDSRDIEKLRLKLDPHTMLISNHRT